MYSFIAIDLHTVVVKGFNVYKKPCSYCGDYNTPHKYTLTGTKIKAKYGYLTKVNLAKIFTVGDS